MVASINSIYQFMVGEVEADPVLTSMNHNRIWAHQAPETSPMPYFIIDREPGDFAFTLGYGRAFDEYRVSVKSVTRNSRTSSDGGALGRNALTRFREIVPLRRPVVLNGYTMVIREFSDFDFDEPETGDNVYYHTGVVLEVTLGHT